MSNILHGDYRMWILDGGYEISSLTLLNVGYEIDWARKYFFEYKEYEPTDKMNVYKVLS